MTSALANSQLPVSECELGNRKSSAASILPDEAFQCGLVVMLLDLDLDAVGIADKELQDTIGAPTPGHDIREALRPQTISEALNVVDLEAQVSEPPVSGDRVLDLKALDEAAASSVQKEPVSFPGGVAELVRDLEPHDVDVKALGRHEIATVEANVGQAFDGHGTKCGLFREYGTLATAPQSARRRRGSAGAW